MLIRVERSKTNNFRNYKHGANRLYERLKINFEEINSHKLKKLYNGWKW